MFSIAGLFAAVGIGELISPVNMGRATQSLLLASGMAFSGALTFPSAWYSLQRLLHKPLQVPTRRGWWNNWAIASLLVVLILSPVLLLGHLAAQNERVSWLVLPLLNIIATGLPVLWLVQMGWRGLAGTSPQRTWGIFASGLVIGPALIMTLELAALLVIGLAWLSWLATQPGMMDELSRMFDTLAYLPNPEEAILRLIEPYLLQPATLLTIFVAVSVIVPLIEELLKPIGVWLLAWKSLTPVEGFVGGILSGAGFALFENLGNTSAGGTDWAVLAASRISTVLLHMLTSGMMGWAFASTWRQKRYLQLGITYALAVTLHGMWNGLAVLGAASLELPSPLFFPPIVAGVGKAAVISLGVLVVVNFGLYLGFNRRLRLTQACPGDAAPIDIEDQTMLPG